MNASEKDYKIEIKPSLWKVDLDRGAYSDWEIQSLFFHANSEDEVWDMLCRYLEDIYDEKGYNKIVAIEFEKKRYQITKYTKKIDWGSAYGDGWYVEIGRLNVIYFNK